MDLDADSLGAVLRGFAVLLATWESLMVVLVNQHNVAVLSETQERSVLGDVR